MLKKLTVTSTLESHLAFLPLDLNKNRHFPFLLYICRIMAPRNKLVVLNI